MLREVLKFLVVEIIIRTRHRLRSKKRAELDGMLLDRVSYFGETISSDDGKYNIRLGDSITSPKQKATGSNAAVTNGTLLLNGILFDGQEIIIKIFTRSSCSYSNADKEIKALKRLTAAGCSHAPTYLGDFIKRPDGKSGGVVRYVLMSKLPGYALSDRDEWRIWWRAEVEKAFDVAIRAVHDCGVYNGSPFLRNVMWDDHDEKCYIVDFDRAVFRYRKAAKMPAKLSSFEYWLHED